MNSYGIGCARINDLSQIDANAIKHYKYNDVDFLLRPKQGARALLVVFHGAVPRDMIGKTPIFRGYNWDYDGISVLCLSDRLFELHKTKVPLAWYLSSENHKLLPIYQDIVECAGARLGLKDIVFFGTSAGGYPSVVLSSIMRKRCIVSNSQFYLERYLTILQRLKQSIESQGDHLSDSSIERFLLKNGFPKKIHLFQNTADTHNYVEHYLPFKSFCRENGYDGLVCSEFENTGDERSKDPHHINFPAKDWVGKYI